MNILKGYKTYLAGIGLVGLGLYQISQGEVETGLQSILTGLSMIFLRSGVSSAAK